ncbi:MAG: prepilin-type N-terminal cleavage/methylation domain-containing protein, partial [Proteobacteria bacterium]|nr:prepilin-type N-terminal cleavage/methylation domain-containing protein [Pseudomonadota bacterium]
MPRNPQCSNSYRHLSAVGQVDPDGHGFSIHRISVFFTNLVRKTSPDSGFTLLELTVVLLILGILLALSIPRLGYLTGQNLSVTSRRISGTVRYLFHQSTLNRTIYRLNYDLKKNEYWVTYR